MGITFDVSSFNSGISKLNNAMPPQLRRAITDVANEILRLSNFEVPHDVGMLQNSGHVESVSDSEAIVGYNKVYAARLHEHPEYRFQKGRKGKYLEDPIKRNLQVFNSFLGKSLGSIFK